MTYYVYMLKCTSSIGKRTYVGYTNNLVKRISLHNTNKGAKFTKGNKWIVIYKKRFILKTKAMSYEYILKNDKYKRLEIYNKFK